MQMKKLLPLLLTLFLPACALLRDAEAVGYVIKEGSTGVFGMGYVHIKSDQAASVPDILVVRDNGLKEKLHEAMLSRSPVKVHYEVEFLIGQPSDLLIDAVEVLEEIK